MPQSKKPRKAYKGPKSQFDLDRLMADEAKLHVETPDTPTSVGQAAPVGPRALPGGTSPAPGRAPRSISRRGALVAAGVGAAGAGAALVARHRRRNAVSKQLIDPFEDVSKRKQRDKDDTWVRRNVYDNRVGVVNREGRPARKTIRRSQLKGNLAGAGAGAALGAGTGALYRGRTGAKVGAFLGGLTGQSVGMEVGRRRGIRAAEAKGQFDYRKVKKSAPDRVYGFTTPAIGQTRVVSARRPAGSKGAEPRLERTIVRARRSNRDHLGKWTHSTKLKGRGNRLLQVKKAAQLPMISNATHVGVLVPSGKHVSHANDFERFTGLSGSYSGLPARTTNGSTKLGHYVKGRDSAARAFVGKAAGLQTAQQLGMRGVFRLGRLGAKPAFGLNRVGQGVYDAGKLSANRTAQAGAGGVLAGGLGASAVDNRRGRKVTG